MRECFTRETFIDNKRITIIDLDLQKLTPLKRKGENISRERSDKG